MAESLEQAVRQAGEPIAKALGLEILKVQCVGKAVKPLVRLILDKDGGVGIKDCEQFHQSFRRTWEITNPMGPFCRFEVSSPGLDRPLTDQRDFQRVVGKLIRVTFHTPIHKEMVVKGRLIALTETGIQLLEVHTKKPQEILVDWEDIAKARLEVEF